MVTNTELVMILSGSLNLKTIKGNENGLKIMNHDISSVG